MRYPKSFETNFEWEQIPFPTLLYPNYYLAHEEVAAWCWCEPVPILDNDGDPIAYVHNELQ